MASRRLIDQRRSDDARNRREVAAAAYVPEPLGPTPARSPDTDDTLQMLLLCAHPALSESAQVALTLRAVAGLSTAQIAAAFLVPEATLAQRISRAKAALREAGARFEAPTPADLPGRLTRSGTFCTSRSTRGTRPPAARTSSTPTWRTRRSGSPSGSTAPCRRTPRPPGCSP